ncbi:MAG: DUF1365 domain-containing protein [Burkholderiaceae bacterium]
MNTARAMISMGSVRHQRLRPASNVFSYGVFTLMLPLRSLGDSALGSKLCSRNRFNLLSFHDSDHGDGKTPLLLWIDQLLRSEGITDADGEVWLQTFPRVLGYVFNPVSFWFCHRHDGALRAIVCEVNNTFGERHCYLLDSGGVMQWGQSHTASKVFHVSPFCAVDGSYRFRFMRTIQNIKGANTERIVARIDYHDAQGPLLLTSVSGKLRALNDVRAAQAFLRYPLMSFGVIARIHWQALRLFIKRVPFFSKPHPPQKALSR